MTEQPTCAEDDCDTVLDSDQVERSEVPVDGTGEWVATGESDEYGEIHEWTGEWKTIHYGVCDSCREREQRLIEHLERLAAE